MTEIAAYILGLLPSVIVAMISFYVQRRQKKRDKEIETRALARKKEGMLALEMQMATAKLSYAVAVAHKRGSSNGEVEEGIAAYELAREKYLAFLNDQAMENVYRQDQN